MTTLRRICTSFYGTCQYSIYADRTLILRDESVLFLKHARYGLNYCRREWRPLEVKRRLKRPVLITSVLLSSKILTISKTSAMCGSRVSSYNNRHWESRCKLVRTRSSGGLDWICDCSLTLAEIQDPSRVAQAKTRFHSFSKVCLHPRHRRPRYRAGLALAFG